MLLLTGRWGRSVAVAGRSRSNVHLLALHGVDSFETERHFAPHTEDILLRTVDDDAHGIRSRWDDHGILHQNVVGDFEPHGIPFRGVDVRSQVELAWRKDSSRAMILRFAEVARAAQNNSTQRKSASRRGSPSRRITARIPCSLTDVSPW